MSKNPKRMDVSKQDKLLLGGVCKTQTNKSIVSRRLSISSIELPKMSPLPMVKQQHQQQHYNTRQYTNFTKRSEEMNRNKQVVSNNEPFLTYILCEMKKMNQSQVQKFKQNVLQSLIVAMDDSNLIEPVPGSDLKHNVKTNHSNEVKFKIHNSNNTFTPSTSHTAQRSFVINSAYDSQTASQQNTFQYGTASSIVGNRVNTLYVDRNLEIPVNCDLIDATSQGGNMKSAKIMHGLTLNGMNFYMLPTE